MNLKELGELILAFSFLMLGFVLYITLTAISNTKEESNIIKTDSIKYDYTLKFKGCDIYTEDSLSVDDLEKISRCIEYRIWSKTNGEFKKQ